MFTFEPWSEEQAMSEKQKPFALLPDGIYNFEVLEAKARTSGNGNPMIEMKLQVWDTETNQENRVFEYLLTTPFMRWKVKHFCDAVGLQSEYESGSLDPDLCVGKTGFAKISIKRGEAKKAPYDGFYPDKNVVDDYVLDSKGTVKFETGGVAVKPLAKEKVGSEKFDDDIPFL
jgi:hypothetical protein